MTPRSFDPVTSREMVGDERARRIEDGARADADAMKFDPPVLSSPDASYWAQCQNGFERSVYLAQFNKRKERNARKAAKQ